MSATKRLLLIFAALATFAAGCSSTADDTATDDTTESTTDEGSGETAASGDKVGFILPDSASSARWEAFDRPLIESACADAGLECLIQNAEGDANTIRNLLCAEKEASFEIESLSFADLDARTEGLSCTEDGDNRVSCAGKIVVTYGTEDTEFPLSAYRVVQEDGEWKYCGEDSIAEFL